LLTHGQWRDEADLAQGYLRSSAYAYARGVYGQAADAELAQRLAQVQVVVQTQDNQEHDILDANEYHQFIGGMAAAVRQLSERAPELVHADLSTLGRARLRPLAQEIARVVRARALNPQWLEAIRAHGYRGGSELAATIEHLFGYAATTRAVPAPLFAALTERYLLDPEQRDFLQQHNPQAMQRMAERLLEAVARGLWPEGRHFVPVLQSLVQQLEDSLETASPGGLPRSPA
jgi:cobaltochelatase CobN